MIVSAIILLMIMVDQIVKYWALHTLSTVNSIPIIQNIFHLTYVENRGAAFSILQNQRWLFLILTPLIIVGMIWILYRNMVYTKCGKVGIYLILAGAIGNFIDRIWHGFVIDLFDFRLIHFPVFNVADIYVVCGVILFFYYYLVQHDKVVGQSE